MAKKRQSDFTRVQLRPGRVLSKRDNVTSTKFRSRKIVMPKEQVIKIKAELTISDYLIKVDKTGNEKDKVGFLIELNRLIRRTSDSLNTYIPQIFEKILCHIRSPYDNIRKNALKVIVSVLELTDDLQLLSNADVLCNNISAVLKNPNRKIASASLTLLNSMLKHHPELICNNFNILFSLLPSERRHYTRKMPIDKETFEYSENDDIDALGYINSFLENLLILKNKNNIKNNEENSIVNILEKSSKSVLLYAGGGLKPIDIAKAHAEQFKPQMNPFDEVEKLRSTIDTLFKLISFYFYQITGKKSNTDDNLFRKEEISDLCILFQLLCNIIDLAEASKYTKVTEETATLLKAVFSTHRKRFPFELYYILPETSPQSLALLNASLCYLHMKFLSSDDSYEDEDGELIMKYLRRFFIQEKTFSSVVKCQCIPYFLKMIELCKYKNDVPEVILLLLKHLVLLLKTRGNANKKILINFLMDMCVLREYRFWIETIPMALWYEWLVSHLKDVSKLEKHIVHVIYKVAKMRHTSFITLLDFNMLKPLLTNCDGDYRDLAICLLHHMDIDNDLFKNIYCTLSQDSIPIDFSVSVIRVLHIRFKENPVSKRPYAEYLQFLFNIAVDVSSFSKGKFLNFQDNEYAKHTVEILEGGSPYCVIPSLHWQEYSKLFEVCYLCFQELPKLAFGVTFTQAVRYLLDSATLIPMHSAVALLKLNDLLKLSLPEVTDEYHLLLMLKLNLSCLLTTSVLTYMLDKSPDSEWFEWTVCTLMDSVLLTGDTAIQTLELIENGDFGREQPDGCLVYHLLRIIKVFVEKPLASYKNIRAFECISRVISNLVEDQCSDRTMIDHPLCHEITDLFVNT